MLLPCIDGQGLKLHTTFLWPDGEPGACKTSATEAKLGYNNLFIFVLIYYIAIFDGWTVTVVINTLQIVNHH